MQLSVIVSTYNRSFLLKSSLESLSVQTANPGDYEVIVVDNNSTDDTEEVAQFFIKRFFSFRYVKEMNQGLSHARNRGFKEAKGKYVAYIDDDAKADERWIESIFDFTVKHPEIVAFGGPYRMLSLVEIPKWYKKSYGAWSLGNDERPIEKNEWINGTNMVYRRTLLEEMCGFHTGIGMSGDAISYGEETNLLLRIKEKNLPIYYVPDIVVEHITADYKMSLTWMLKSRYMNGFSSFETFEIKRQLPRQFLITIYYFIKGPVSFVLSKEKYIKTNILESFSSFIWNLGLTIRMFKR